MIPFAILSGEIYLEENIEIRILDLSEASFSFRLPSAFDSALTEPVKIRLFFLHYEESLYREILLENVTLSCDEKTKYYSVWRAENLDSAFSSESKVLMKAYMDYIRMKLYGDEGALSEEMTGYPAERDQEISKDFVSFKRAMFEKLDVQEGWGENALQKSHFLTVESPWQYQAFLEKNLTVFIRNYFEESFLLGHPAAELSFEGIMIGSQYCMQLMPSEEEIDKLLQKCKTLGLLPLIAFPPIAEEYLPAVEKMIKLLDAWCIKEGCRLELIINDWAMPALIRKEGYDCFDLTLGSLFNKRRKDSRMAYKKAADAYGMDGGENALNADFFANYLKEQGIEGEISEASGHFLKKGHLMRSMIMPYYQMNTAGHCTLCAAVKEGDRGRQARSYKCQDICREHAFLYPEHLQMTGRYNSLFGLDKRVLEDRDYFEKMTSDIDRVIWHLL